MEPAGDIWQVGVLRHHRSKAWHTVPVVAWPTEEINRQETLEAAVTQVDTMQ